jgi:trk system potassium uptake protein TrkH
MMSANLREAAHLRRRYRVVLTALGFILLLSSALGAVPVLVALWLREGAANLGGFALPAALQLMAGLALWKGPWSVRNETPTFSEGGIIVLLSWVLVMALSALPFVLVLGLPFSRAFFESVSGWTTTGLSVVDVTTAPASVLIWRSLIQLAGGAGLAILMMSALAGATGAGISGAEGRGDQLVPQVRESARLVLVIYLATATAGVIAYVLVGMTPFDALNHSFAAVSTGGFSTRVESLGYWNSPVVEAVTIALMWLGNLSFITAWLLWRGRLGAVAGNGEIRLTAVVLPTAVILLFFLTCMGTYPHLGKAARVAVFEATTALTTTGFSTVGYASWNGAGFFIMIMLMLIGGGTCSTAGGIKQIRIYLVWRQLCRDLRQLMLPRGTVSPVLIREGEQTVAVEDGRFRQVSTFLYLYLLTYAAGVLILCASGFSLQDSLFEFASALGTVGLSMGVTTADMPDPALWAETTAMFLGRLEFTVILVSAVRLLRDLRVMVRLPGRG